MSGAMKEWSQPTMDLFDEVIGIILNGAVEQAVTSHAAFAIAEVPAGHHLISVPHRSIYSFNTNKLIKKCFYN